MALVALLGDEVQGKNGTVKVDTLTQCDQVGIYFSAHWCPPCRGFTPELAKTYKVLKEASKNIEVVFVSSDRDEESFNGYYEEMPWLALPFANRSKKDELAMKYGVSGIPTLVLVNPKNGELVSKNGRGLVMGDREGNNFPWSD